MHFLSVVSSRHLRRFLDRKCAQTQKLRRFVLYKGPFGDSAGRSAAVPGQAVLGRCTLFGLDGKKGTQLIKDENSYGSESPGSPKTVPFHLDRTLSSRRRPHT